jgi:HlyD family secretion protein
MPKSARLILTVFLGSVLTGVAYKPRAISTGETGRDTASSLAPLDLSAEDMRPHKVAAPGRIEPDGGVIRVGAPIDFGVSTISRLLVAEGDRVEAGQVIAILDKHDSAEATRVQAESHVGLALATLDSARQGAAAAAVNVRQAAVALTLASLAFARREMQRADPLRAHGDMSVAAYDEKA